MEMGAAFELKKIIGNLLMPLPLSFLLVAMGLLLLAFGRRSRGYLSLLSGIAIVVLCSLQPVVVTMAKPLENRYVKFFPERYPNVDFVVVMGGCHVTDTHLPESDLLCAASTKRLLEGLRVQRFYPQSKLVFSGSNLEQKYSHAEASTRVARSLGVTDEKIIQNPSPSDSEDEVASVKKIVTDKPFVLVTSAAHMHRTLLEFQRIGLKPIPAPTAYAWRSETYTWWPKGGWLNASAELWHEYLGLLWLQIRDFFR
jgi:uncharacterized SAM-binding protein YcdF (DUF218 family)